jgi:ABC-type branched-subunit amino acid transport system substrate-binding protein
MPRSRSISRRLFGRRLAQGLASGLATAWLPERALGQAAAPTEAPGSEIVLGQSASFSGSFAAQAAAYRDGARACFAAVNAAGGVHGRRIRLVSLDDGYQVDRAVANTRQLIDDHQALALFSPMWTNTVKAALAISAPAGVPMVGPYTGYEALYADNRSPVFTTRASFLDELGHIVRHLLTLGTTRIGLLHYDSASGRELRADTERLMQPAGLQPAALGTMAVNSGAAGAVARQLAQAGLQALVIGVSGSDAVAFLRAFRAVEGSAATRCYARSLVGVTQLVAELGPLAEGLSVSQTAPHPLRDRAPVAAEYRRLLAALEPRRRPDHIGLEGLIAAKLVVEGLRRAGPRPSRSGLVAAIEGLQAFDAGGYWLRYGPGRRHGSRHVELTLVGPGGRLLA